MAVARFETLAGCLFSLGDECYTSDTHTGDPGGKRNGGGMPSMSITVVPNRLLKPGGSPGQNSASPSTGGFLHDWLNARANRNIQKHPRGATCRPGPARQSVRHVDICDTTAGIIRFL